MAKQELDEAEAGKSTGIAILSFISVVTLIFYFFVKNALGVIRVKFIRVARLSFGIIYLRVCHIPGYNGGWELFPQF